MRKLGTFLLSTGVQAFFLHREQLVELVYQATEFLRVNFVLYALAKRIHLFAVFGCHGHLTPRLKVIELKPHAAPQTATVVPKPIP